jgi:hypothetical protein
MKWNSQPGPPDLQAIGMKAHVIETKANGSLAPAVISPPSTSTCIRPSTHYPMEKAARSRSKAACQFCRTRKLKCDNLQPECSACRAREIPCEYVARNPAPRPSNAAIQALQAENKRLRQLLERSSISDDGTAPKDSYDGEVLINSPHRPSVSSQAAIVNTENQEHNQNYQLDGDVSPRRTSSGGLPTSLLEHGSSSHLPLQIEQDEDHHSDPAHVAWDNLLRGIEEFESPLDSATKGAIRSQLVAASARQR